MNKRKQEYLLTNNAFFEYKPAHSSLNIKLIINIK
jgi:hypothetical protein